MKCRLPIILKQNNHELSSFTGILGLAPPRSWASGPGFVEHLWDQDRLDRNMFAVLPGKEPKITYGGYQEEGKPIGEQHFYSEVMNKIVAINVQGSFHWSLPLRNISIGDDFFRLQANNV